MVKKRWSDKGFVCECGRPVRTGDVAYICKDCDRRLCKKCGDKKCELKDKKR